MGTARRACRALVVVAAAATSVVVVGGTATASRQGPGLIHFDRVSAMPAVASGAGGFGGLSCPSPRLCVAVGTTATGQAGWTAASENRGSWTWSPFRTLQPVTVAPDFLTAVSCPSPTRCVAVGYAMDGHAQNQWDSGYAIVSSAAVVGRSWRWSVPTPILSGSTGIDRLTGVSCPTSVRCVAVGLTVSQQGIVASASWDGSDWTWSKAMTVSSDAAGFGELLAVSCPTSSTCVAVGDDASSHGVTTPSGAGVTTIGTRVGTVWTWSAESVVTADATGRARLTSVSCPTVTRCVAVGVDAALAGVETVGVLAPGGLSWTRATQLATSPDSRYVLDLATSVSCVPTLCVVVGTNASGDGVFAEARGPLPAGSWSRVFDPAHGALRSPGPQAVSCPLADDCVQVGVTFDKENVWAATSAAPTFARGVRGAPGNARATITWVPPAFDGGARIENYRVTAEPGGRSCTVIVRRATPNTCTMHGLANGTRYRFVVIARNASGVSARSRPSRAVIPSPFQPPVSSPFTRAVHEFVASQPGILTASIYDVLTGQSWTIDPSSVQHTASIVKVEILATLLYDEQRNHVQMTAATRALATAMIEGSDNNAAQALYLQVGQEPGLAAFNQLVGLTGTAANWAWGYTDTTALDQTRLVRLFVLPNQVLDTASRRFGLELMRHVAPFQAWGVSSGPPPGVVVALKNGWYPTGPGDWQVNSVGWVDGDRRNYVIAVLTNADATMGTGVSSIEALSRMLWQNLGRRPSAHDR